MKSDKDEVKNCDIEFIPGNSINIYENHATRFKNAREWSAKKSLIMDIFLSSKCITIVISSLNLRRQNACELVVYVQDCYTYTIFVSSDWILFIKMWFLATNPHAKIYFSVINRMQFWILIASLLRYILVLFKYLMKSSWKMVTKGNKQIKLKRHFIVKKI